MTRSQHVTVLVAELNHDQFVPCVNVTYPAYNCSVLTGNKFASDAVIHVLKFGCTKNVVYLAFLSAEICYGVKQKCLTFLYNGVHHSRHERVTCLWPDSIELREEVAYLHVYR